MSFKQFDSASIANRLTTRLSTTSTWSQLIGDSATVSLINSIGESNAEIVRYLENLLSEAKWGVAQNLSSYITQCPYIGYIPQKNVSALGNIYISHDSKLSLLGSTLFSLDDLQSNLSYYSGSDISIPAGTICYTSGGIQFFTTQSMTYTYGLQYLEIPVMQGVISKSSPIAILGNPFEEIVITDSLIEDASNDTSMNFLKVALSIPGTATPIDMVRYEDIFLADSTTYAFDLRVTNDLTSLVIRFGDGVTGALLPSGSTVTYSYVQSLGASGNINTTFIVNKIKGSFSSPLYCSNLDSILGGDGQDTVVTIKNKAPNAYLLKGGSIVSTKEYKAIIESLPYINTATVYAELYTNPVTNSTQNTIMYSAITTSGEDANDQNNLFVSTVIPNLIFNENSPLDILVYAPPKFLHMRYNLKGVIATSTSTSLIDLQSTIQQDIYNNFGTLVQSFDSIYDNSALTSFISKKYENYGIGQIYTQLEAVQNLLPSTFAEDPNIVGNYKQTFYFDPSYSSLYGFDNAHPYCLKINVIFTCSQCYANSRTLLVVPANNNPTTYSCYLTGIPTSGNINVWGQVIPVTVTSGMDLYEVMLAVYTGIIANSTLTSNFTITYSQSGTISITPILTGNASNLISIPTVGGLGGVAFRSSVSKAYKINQYPYIAATTITDKDYTNTYILGGSSIIPNTSSSYIPFVVSLDYESLNPSDLVNVKLGYGSISIPSTINGNSYLNFALGETTDANVVIEVIAQPTKDLINPYYNNNIIKMGQIVQNSTYVIDDCIISLKA